MRHPMRLRSTLAVLLLAVTATAGAGITGAASAATADTVRDDAIAWVVPQVTDEGALISAYTGAPDPSLTAQAALALAGAGAAPSTVAKMVDYLEGDVEAFVAPGGAADSPGALGWLILTAVATDRDPHAFGGVDLVSRLEATRQADGLFGAGDPTYDGVFRQGLSLVALSSVGATDADGLAWLQGQQCADGGFVAYRADLTVPCPAVDAASFAGPDTNSTALAAMALAVAGDADAAEAAMAWLDGVRTAGGGFAYLGDPALDQDANSTGVVALAYRTVRGVTDQASVAALASLQVPSSGDPLDRGGIAFQAGDPLFPDLMATTQALLGLAGQALPFAPVPNQEPVWPTTTLAVDPDPVTPTTPDGGVAPVAAAVTGTPTYTG